MQDREKSLKKPVLNEGVNSMKNMTVANITKAVQGTYVGPDNLLETEIAGVVTDSRKVESGYIYVPFRGERVDGHSFIPQVFEKGALVTLTEEPLEELFSTRNLMPYILVESAPQALKDLAAFYRQQLDCTIVGVTGSVGKTSTKEMIASVLSQHFCVQKTQGNFNNEVGLPLTIFSIGEEHQVAVVEMGISEFGEMSRLGAIAKPDICVITNIGVAHLEMLGTRDGILQAKTEVVDYINPKGTLILNGDDDKLSTIMQVRDCGERIVEFYGVGAESEYGITKQAYAQNLSPVGTEGIQAHYNVQGTEFDAMISIPGEHNVYNAMAASLVGARLGMSMEEIRAGITKATTIQGRNNRLVVNGITIIDDCYNANPVSMKASLDVLNNAPGRKIAILGDMGELGTDEINMHAEVGTYAVQKGVDFLLCSGGLSVHMADAAKEALCHVKKPEGNINPAMKVMHFSGKEELVTFLLGELKEGDTVLVKASHFMQYEKIVQQLQGRER